MGHTVLVLFAKIVVPVFLFGMAGSALVVVVTLVRDFGEVASSDHENVSEL